MTVAAWRALVRADSRSLWRDPLLGWVLFLPVVLAIFLRVVVPRAGQLLLTTTGFDLAPLHPLIMGGYLMTAPGIVGMVIGFLLLDERDGRTLMALRLAVVDGWIPGISNRAAIGCRNGRDAHWLSAGRHQPACDVVADADRMRRKHFGSTHRAGSGRGGAEQRWPDWRSSKC